jgi:hypothetical protein
MTGGIYVNMWQSRRSTTRFSPPRRAKYWSWAATRLSMAIWANKEAFPHLDSLSTGGGESLESAVHSFSGTGMQ